MVGGLKYVFTAATAAVVAGVILFEIAAHLVWGPTAVHFLTPAERDVQTDYDVTYRLAADGTRVGCAGATATGRPLVFVGDSFTFGQGVPDGQDFVARIGCRLRENRVVNLGSIGQDFLYYDLAIRSLAPSNAQAIILLLYENDLPPADWDSMAWAAKRWLYRWSHTIVILRRLKQRLDQAHAAVDWDSLKIDGRLNNPKAVIATDPGFFEQLTSPPPERLALLDRGLGWLLEAAQNTVPNARIFLAVAPEASTLSARHREFYRSLSPSVPLPPADRPSALYRRAKASCESKPGCSFIDLYPRLSPMAEKLYFAHDFHWNEAGHAVIAEAMIEALSGAPSTR